MIPFYVILMIILILTVSVFIFGIHKYDILSFICFMLLSLSFLLVVFSLPVSQKVYKEYDLNIQTCDNTQYVVYRNWRDDLQLVDLNKRFGRIIGPTKIIHVVVPNKSRMLIDWSPYPMDKVEVVDAPKYN